MLRAILTFAVICPMCFCCARELQLPSIDPTLTETTARADYLLEHYWDNMDFGDADAVCDRDFMGGNLSTFVSAFALASPEGINRGVTALVYAARPYAAAANSISRLSEAYLLDPASPVYDEHAYIIFADAMIAAGYSDSNIIAELRSLAALSQPGSIAPDLNLICRNGKQTRLSELMQGRETIVMFYNPDCDECSRTIDTLISQGATNVVAIYAGNDIEMWKASSKVPKQWDDVIVSPDCEADEIYAIPAMPTLYLIGDDGVIIKKDMRL